MEIKKDTLIYKNRAGLGAADHFAFISSNDAITILEVASCWAQPLFIGPAVTHGCTDASALTPVCPFTSATHHRIYVQVQVHTYILVLLQFCQCVALHQHYIAAANCLHVHVQMCKCVLRAAQLHLHHI